MIYNLNCGNFFFMTIKHWDVREKNKRRTKQKLTEQTNHKDNYKKNTKNKLLVTRNFKEHN